MALREEQSKKLLFTETHKQLSLIIINQLLWWIIQKDSVLPFSSLKNPPTITVCFTQEMHFLF